MTRLVPVVLFVVVAAAAVAMAIAPLHGFVTMPDGTELVRIPGSWFLMGSQRGEPDEKPVHRVWLSAFLMDRTEVTQEAYGGFVLADPSHSRGSRLPEEQVSWAAEGLKPCYDEETALCDFPTNGYRLPAEAEWEYACRAGTDTEYPFGRIGWNLSADGWFEGNAEGVTHPVGQRRPSRWGLFDMLGNVAGGVMTSAARATTRRAPSAIPPGRRMASGTSSAVGPGTRRPGNAGQPVVLPPARVSRTRASGATTSASGV